MCGGGGGNNIYIHVIITLNNCAFLLLALARYSHPTVLHHVHINMQMELEYKIKWE